jgi:hypothetical protein
MVPFVVVVAVGRVPRVVDVAVPFPLLVVPFPVLGGAATTGSVAVHPGNV